MLRCNPIAGDLIERVGAVEVRGLYGSTSATSWFCGACGRGSRRTASRDRTVRNARGHRAHCWYMRALNDGFDAISSTLLEIACEPDLSDVLDEDGEAGIEFRCQIIDGEPFWHTGDACWDTDHSGAWGAGYAPLFTSVDSLAECVEDVLDEALSGVAEIKDIVGADWSGRLSNTSLRTRNAEGVLLS